MKKSIYIIALALFLSACSEERYVGLADVEKENIANTLPSDAMEGELLIKFVPEMTEILDATSKSRSLTSRSGIPSTDEILDILDAYHFERVFPVDSRTEERTRESGLHLWYLIRFDEGTDLQKAADKLSGLGEISQIQCNRKIYKSYNQQKRFIPGSTTDVHSRNVNDLPFNDPGLCYQWGYINRGGYDFEKEWAKTIAGSDVNCEEAWEKCTGDPSIIVAVMDEGVMWNHPDLEPNMWVNEDEIYGDRTDNDNNGYQGDRYGYNFATDRGYLATTGSNDTGHGCSKWQWFGSMRYSRRQLGERTRRSENNVLANIR